MHTLYRIKIEPVDVDASGIQWATEEPLEPRFPLLSKLLVESKQSSVARVGIRRRLCNPLSSHLPRTCGRLRYELHALLPCVNTLLYGSVRILTPFGETSAHLSSPLASLVSPLQCPHASGRPPFSTRPIPDGFALGAASPSSPSSASAGACAKTTYCAKRKHGLDQALPQRSTDLWRCHAGTAVRNNSAWLSGSTLTKLSTSAHS